MLKCVSCFVLFFSPSRRNRIFQHRYKETADLVSSWGLPDFWSHYFRLFSGKALLIKAVSTSSPSPKVLYSAGIVLMLGSILNLLACFWLSLSFPTTEASSSLGYDLHARQLSFTQLFQVGINLALGELEKTTGFFNLFKTDLLLHLRSCNELKAST